VGGETSDGSVLKAVLLRTNTFRIVSATYTSNPAGGFWGIGITLPDETSDKVKMNSCGVKPTSKIKILNAQFFT